MDRLGRMKKQRRRARRGERRRDLAPDQAGFAHAADDDMAGGRHDHPDGVLERSAKRLVKAADGIAIGGEQPARGRHRGQPRRPVLGRVVGIRCLVRHDPVPP